MSSLPNLHTDRNTQFSSFKRKEPNAEEDADIEQPNGDDASSSYISHLSILNQNVKNKKSPIHDVSPATNPIFSEEKSTDGRSASALLVSNPSISHLPIT